MRVDNFLLENEKKRTERKFYRNKSPFDMLRGKKSKDTMEFFPHIDCIGEERGEKTT